jgi:hypothetical protein
VGSVASFSTAAFRTNANARIRVEVSGYIREMSNALQLIKDNSWASIAEIPLDTQKHLAFSNGQYTIADGAEVKNGIAMSFIVSAVYRDVNRQIVENGGTLDPHSKRITFTAAWTDVLEIPLTMSSRVIINDWNTKRWRETLQSEFSQGTNDLTVVTNNVDGEVQMESVLYADWCNPAWTMTTSDLPGNGVAQALTTIPNEVFAGTGQNASGLSFIDIGLDESNPPIVSVLGTFDGYKTNDVFGENNFAYLATDTNFKEVVIVDILNAPFHLEGYFDVPGNGNASAVSVSGNTGFAVAGSKLYAFDLTAKTGSRLQLGSAFNLAGTGKTIKISGQYAYVVTTSTSKQLQIINISNPASMTEAAWAQVDGNGGTDVFISDDTNRAYLTTAVSTTKKELFILDISTKSGARPTLSSYETNGMSPRGVARVSDLRLIVVGTSGEEYQVVNIENELSPVRCGGMNNDLGIYDVVPHTNLTGNAYSYIVTGDPANEFRIIRGGPGGHGGQNGQGYAPNGSFTSRVFDTGSSLSYYYYIEWDETIPANSDLRFQVRAGNSPDLSMVPWIGPDGTSGTYFTTFNGETLPSLLNLNRYIQFKAYYSSDTVGTPVLSEFRITYQ